MTFDASLPRRLGERSALLTPAEMGVADRTAIAMGHPGPVLMEAAGRAVARAIMRLEKKATVLVLAGPGNNGGDGYVVARYLAQQGWPVAVAALAPPRAGSDAAWAAARWHGPVAPFAPEEAARADLVIDAVFGAGLTRPVDGLGGRHAVCGARASSRSTCRAGWMAPPADPRLRAAGGADRHVLPPEAGPSAAAGPNAVRRDRAGRYRHARRRAGPTSAPRPSPTCPTLWPLPRLRADGAQIQRAATSPSLGGAR